MVYPESLQIHSDYHQPLEKRLCESVMQVFSKGLQAFVQDWRLAEVKLLVTGLALAVAAVASVGFLVDRFEAALKRDAAQLLGGDLVISADRPVDPLLIDQGKSLGLQATQTVSFPSMAANAAQADATVLVAVKSVAPGYPLRGQMVLADAQGQEQSVVAIPPAGEIWVDEPLLAAINVKLGDMVQLGSVKLKITRLITIEPDRGAQFTSFAPRVMLNAADLSSTELVGPGARVQYRTLFAGQPPAVRLFSAQVKDKLARGQRLETLESGRPEMAQTLDRAQRFLALVSIVAALIASVAVFLAAREYASRQQGTIAIRRALGAKGSEILGTLAVEFAILALIACLLGAAVGWGVHWVLAWLLADLVGVALPLPTLRPVIIGVAIGAVLTAGVVLPRVMQLRNVPTLAVIRKEAAPMSRGTITAYVLAALATFALLVMSVRDTNLALGVAAGFAVGCAVFALIVRANTLGMAKLGPSLRSFSLRSAMAACARRPQGVIVQTLALTIGLMAISLLVLIRSDLVGAWRASVPPDAPNRFVVNLQPDQVQSFKLFVQGTGLAAPDLYPMIRARLVEKNGQPIGPESFTDDRAKRLVDREFNASYATELPKHNRIKEGAWQKPDTMEVSMESGIMETLGLAMGDALTFDIAGQRATVKITSTRAVNWDSLRVNFFAVSTPAAFANQPQSYITAIHVPDDKAKQFQGAVKQFPNLTIIDTRTVINQVQGVLNQVIRAVEFLFLFALAAGVVVLFVATTATRDERKRESAVMRALGASTSQVRATQGWEFALIGLVAGLLAATGAAVLAWLIARYGFNFAYTPSPLVALGTVIAGVLVTLAGGWWAVRKAVTAPPVVTLREAL
jgi:putative ABC transport system permease protein